MGKIFKLFLLLQIFLSVNLFSIFTDDKCSMFCHYSRCGEIENVRLDLGHCHSEKEREYLVNWKDKLTRCKLNKNNTSLVWAVMNNYKEIAEVLIEHADQESKNRALSFAIQYDCYDVIKRLLNAGAKIEGDDKKDKSPLFRSVFKGNYQIFRLLIKHLLKTKNEEELINILNKKDSYSNRSLLHIIVRKHPDSEKKSRDFPFETIKKFDNFFGYFISKCGCYLNFEDVDADGFSIIHWLAKFYDNYSLYRIFNYIRDCECFKGRRHRYVRDLLSQKSENDAKYTPFDSARRSLCYKTRYSNGINYDKWERGYEVLDSSGLRTLDETLNLLSNWSCWANRRNGLSSQKRKHSSVESDTDQKRARRD